MFGLFKKKPAEHAKPAKSEFFRACNVYCRPDADQAIVASVYNHGGLMAEKPGGALIVKFSDSTTLHETVRAALDACEYEKNFDYSGRTKNDWPAYKVSGFKTMKRFEAEFVRLLVKGVNDKNFFYDVTTPEFGEFGLHWAAMVNAYDGNYGKAIHYIIKNYFASKELAGS